MPRKDVRGFLRKLFADSAYAGSVFRDGAAKAMRELPVEIVKRTDDALHWFLNRNN